jgi:glyoxylase-like metal-dependent hydrolase (beta-lactamase superfamily II)
VRIHALQTGTVQVKQAFLHPRPGPFRRLGLLLPGPFAPPLPIHAWLIEHDGRNILVDCGETAGVQDPAPARYSVAPADELPHALAAVGVTPADLETVLLTHLHSDHFDGAVHVPGPVLVGEDEWRYAHSRAGRLVQRLARAPLPTGVDFRPVALSDGPFGAFASSRRLTKDGRVVAVATPGHTPGHVSVIAIDDAGNHVLLAGDATDTLEQLHALRSDAMAPKPRVHVATLELILAHGREHPTVYLPSHDPESVARLTKRATLPGPRHTARPTE